MFRLLHEIIKQLTIIDCNVTTNDDDDKHAKRTNSH